MDGYHSSRYFLPKRTPQPSSCSGLYFHQLYTVERMLGRGAYSTVLEGFHRSSGTIAYAVKCIDRTKLAPVEERDIHNEVSILHELRHHNNIIRMYDIFTESRVHYIVMERMRGGELFDRILDKTRYTESEARETCRNILEAVRYCHEHKIAHRDLKPENMLLVSKHDCTSVKIADFGYATRVYEPKSLTTTCGTRSYVAPEILNGIPYDERVDLWSIGVILYILLCGLQPFSDDEDDNDEVLYRQICNGDYHFNDLPWRSVSFEAINMIQSFMQVDPTSRLSASEALTRHPWFQQRRQNEVSPTSVMDIDANFMMMRGASLNHPLKGLKKHGAQRRFNTVIVRKV